MVDLTCKFYSPYHFLFLALTSLSTNRIYTLPVKVGATNQQFSLQVDTGSSDLVSNLYYLLPLPILSLLYDSGSRQRRVLHPVVIQRKVIYMTLVQHQQQALLLQFHIFLDL